MTYGRLLALTLAACVLSPVLPAAVAADDSSHPRNPNIVVFYLDDVNPHDGRLWSNPGITPTIHDFFIANGVKFTNAIGETPLCCPGRAGLLTGLHTHNHGVIKNNARLFSPDMHIGKAMQDAGYTTMLIGKYLNLANKLTEDQWLQHGAGWSHLDAINEANGRFYDYTVHTKTGNVEYGRIHSTRMVAERTISHLRETPSGSPVFAIASLYNLHGPNLPMPEYKDDPRCNDMPPWNPESYNEADVSDKPLFVRRQPLLPYPDGWPMVGYCREMIGVDWLIEQITSELQTSGRLDNTLLVFTADNGSTWGAHRLGQKKLTPYATPVPLYMWSPSSWDWGAHPRNIDDLAVNIDLAPTFCDLAVDCSLGPYSGGQTSPDGLSLVPLLQGAADSLERDAVLESGWAGERTWQALRTTSSNALGQWHYIEWQDGFRELYNSIDDPAELTNLGRDPSLERLRVELSVRLAELFQEGRAVAAPARPDAGIATNADGPYKQFGVYGSVPTREQTKRLLGVTPNASYDYWVRITNRGSISGSFLVTGLSSGSDQLTVTYLVGGADVTSQVEGGAYLLEDVAPNESMTMVIRIRVAETAPLGAKRTAVVRIASSTDSTLVDVVKAVAER